MLRNVYRGIWLASMGKPSGIALPRREMSLIIYMLYLPLNNQFAKTNQSCNRLDKRIPDMKRCLLNETICSRMDNVPCSEKQEVVTLCRACSVWGGVCAKCIDQ